MLFDGECTFCRRWIARWAERTGDRVRFVPFQEAGGLAAEISPESLAGAVHLIRPGQCTLRGAEAVFAMPGMADTFWARVYRTLPGFRSVSDAAYAQVSRHRTAASRFTRLLWGNEVGRPHWRIGSAIFLRLLGLVHAIAFGSLAVQMPGLIGARGLQDATGFLAAVAERVGLERFWLVPTIFWGGSSDAVLIGVAWVGCVLGLLVLCGVWQGPLLLLGWVFYLSLSSVGGVFLGFQWDAFLLEATLLAVFLAPWKFWIPPGSFPEPPRAAHGLLRFLLFRLMFLSGLVKLTSGDPSWSGLTALMIHYETQPLPTVIGWAAHQLPGWFHRFSAALMFGIELVVPLFVFAPRRLRMLAFSGIAFLMVLIALTGNYCFFNLLTLALALFLLDDSQWPGRLSRRASPGVQKGPTKARLQPRVATVAACVLAPLALIPFAAECLPARSLPRALETVHGWVAPFRSINGYGLFRVMTQPRHEIQIEGSADGITWKPYGFRWKPGPEDRMPAFVAPHQPRLDWQMWFAALGRIEHNPWLVQLCRRLLEGEPTVLRLMGENPFPDHPPRYIRGMLYEYHFTRAGESGWWEAGLVRAYTPEFSLPQR